MYAIPATYVGGSMEYDIAVLKVKGSRVLAESNATEAIFADSDNISVLDQAIAVGNPEDLGLSATLGHVSVDSEYITMNASDGLSVVQQRVIRIDTPINSGNSGGGLFNSSGEVIGIVNAKLMSSENMGYALPSSFVKYVAENIIYYCDGTQYENVYRCYLGIEVRASKMYTVYDLDTGKVLKREEVSVSKLTDGGLAIGKLQVGDVINSITIDGVKYDTVRLHSVTDPMLNARVGSVVVVNVTRDGVVMDVAITISNASLTMIK
jgi:serine protease Do